MKHGYVTVNKIKLHYVEQGEGPLVILLHGFPDFWYGWRKQLPVLSQHYRVVAPDMRGYNLSDKPQRVRDYRLSILASDIAELIKSFNAGPALVVGHDWGGGVAWALATYYPELVAKLAILNVPHPAELIKAWRSFNLSQWKKSYYVLLFQLPGIPEWVISRNLPTFFRWVFEKTYYGGPDLDAVIEQYVEAYSRTGTLTATINYYRAAMRNMKDLKLGGTHCLPMPVLMLWGEHDKALGKELTYHTGDYCNDFNIIYDPESGHWLQINNPELVNTKLLEFFG